MVYADLHVHTTRSDGSLTLEDVPDAARRAGVSVVGLTDHDRTQPFGAPVVERDGVTIVHGIELRVECPDGQRVDLLGYGVEPTTELEALLESIQRNRIERGRRIVERVEQRLGIDLDLTVERGFGRPAVARAIDAHQETDYDYQGAFDHLIGNDGPCYVRREVPTFDRGRRLLSAACSLVSLAHPLRYPDPERVLDRAGDLDAIEVAYPYDETVDGETVDGETVDDETVDDETVDDETVDDETVDCELVERAVERFNLLKTGGSDAHDDRLGVAGLSEAEYRTLPLPTP